MEVILLRFSHLGEKIFDSLDNESISKSRQTSRLWRKYLQNKGFLHIRKIKAKVVQFHTLGDTWSKVFKTAPTATLMNLEVAVNQCYKNDPNLRYYEGLTPSHIAASTGKIQLYQEIAQKTQETHPIDITGKTPFHYAAQNGHFEMCKV